MSPEYGILHNDEEGVDFIPANIDLSSLEFTLVNVMSRENIMKEYTITEKALITEFSKKPAEVFRKMQKYIYSF